MHLLAEERVSDFLLNSPARASSAQRIRPSPYAADTLRASDTLIKHQSAVDAKMIPSNRSALLSLDSGFARTS